jgi:hypothetical protein
MEVHNTSGIVTSPRSSLAELLLGRNLARPGERPTTSPADLQHRVEAARARKAINKGATNLEKTFLGKEKYMRFAATRR